MVTRTRQKEHLGYPFSSTDAEKQLQIFIIGHELRIEALEILLSRQPDLWVCTTLMDVHSSTDAILSALDRQRRHSRPIDVVLLDWDGDASANMALLVALTRARQRTLVVTSLMLPSDLEGLQKAGARGFVLTTSSSRQLYTAIAVVAQGNTFFPSIPLDTISQLRVKRQLVFYPERLMAYMRDITEVPLTALAQEIIERLPEANAVSIAASVDRQYGTIRTALCNMVYPFFRLLAKKYRLPVVSVRNQKEAFEVALMLGIFVYQ